MSIGPFFGLLAVRAWRTNVCPPDLYRLLSTWNSLCDLVSTVDDDWHRVCVYFYRCRVVFIAHFWQLQSTCYTSHLLSRLAAWRACRLLQLCNEWLSSAAWLPTVVVCCSWHVSHSLPTCSDFFLSADIYLSIGAVQWTVHGFIPARCLYFKQIHSLDASPFYMRFRIDECLFVFDSTV